MKSSISVFLRQSMTFMVVIFLMVLFPAFSLGFVLNGTDKISDADVSLDGSLLVTKGSYQEGIKIWKLPSMELYKHIQDKTISNKTNVAIAPDNKTLAVIENKNKNLIFYDMNTWEKIKSFQLNGISITKHYNKIFSFASKESLFVYYSGGAKKEICFLDINTGSIKKVDAPMGKIPGWVATSHNSDLVASVNHRDTLIHIWNAKTGKKVKTVKIGKGCYYASISPDGSMLAAYANGKTTIWDTKTWKIKEELPFGMTRLTFSPDSKKIVYSTYQKMCLYDLTTKEKTPKYHFRDRLDILMFIPGMDALLFAEENYIGFWHILMEKEFAQPGPGYPKIFGHPYLYMGGKPGFKVSSDKKYILAGDINTVTTYFFYGIWRTSDGMLVNSFSRWPLLGWKHNQDMRLSSFSFSQKENQIQFFVNFETSSKIVTVDLSTGEKIKEIPTDLGTDIIYKSEFSPDFSKVAVMQGSNLIVLDAKTGKKIGNAIVSDGGSGFKWSEKGDLIYFFNRSAKGKKIIEFYELNQNKIIHKIPWPANLKRCEKVLLSPDNNTLVFYGSVLYGKKSKYGLLFWDLANNKQINRNNVKGIGAPGCFTKDSKILVTKKQSYGSKPTIIRLYDMTKGLVVKKINVGKDLASADKHVHMVFSDDEQYLYASDDTYIGVWQIPKEEGLSPKEYTNKGIYFKNKGLLDMAIKEYNKAIEINPKYKFAYANRGAAYQRKDLYGKAIKDFDAAIAIDAKHVFSYYQRGKAYSKQGIYNKAIADFSKTIEIKPDYIWSYRSRGFANFCIGQFAKSASDYETFLAKRPKNEFSIIHLYIAQKRSGKDGTQNLAELSKQFDLESWPGKLLSLFMDNISQEEILAAAKDTDPKKENKKMREAYLYLGEFYFVKKQQDKAEKMFKKCIDVVADNASEHQVAKAELEHMGYGSNEAEKKVKKPLKVIIMD